MLECTSIAAPAAHGGSCLCHSPAFAKLAARFDARVSRRSFLAGGLGAAGSALSAGPAAARIPAAPATPVAFTNIRLFDGRGDALRSGLRVVVEGDRIRSVEPADRPQAAGLQIVDGGGRTLMPGLIDAHWHAMMCALPLLQLVTADVGYINLVAAEEAERTLMRGFTSVRDLAGPSFGLKRAIDGGIVAGPRIWPSGAMISQTGGHGDFRLPWEVPAAPAAPLSRGDVIGGGAIADGVERVLQRAREQLMLGASQLKLAAGGGVSSNYDPIDVAQYTEAEFRAAVDAAENWGTYVTVHAYTPRAIQTAIRAGVKCIDHGQLMDETTARMMADKGIWLSIQPFVENEFANVQSNPLNQAKQREVFAGTDRAYGYAKKYGLKTAWGTDLLFEPRNTANQGGILASMVRWYTPAEVLRMATSTNAELLAMSGPRSPYPAKVGTIEPGAHADLLVIDGDPLTDLKLIADPERTLSVIMKDGRFFRNRLAKG